MNIAIFGATGPTGHHLLNQALAAGHTVTAFVRDPQRLPTAVRSKVRVVIGDVLKNTASIEDAIAGQDVVLSAIGSNVRKGGDPVNSVGSRHIVAAMQKQGVKRLIAISTIGIADTVERMSKFTHFVLRMIIGTERLEDDQLQEDVVYASDLDWTLVRPPRLTDGDGTGSVTADPKLYTKFSSELKRADLAKFMLDEASNNQFVRTPVTVVN